MKISLILPTYNRFNLARNAIRSVLEQSYKDFEIIIIDQSDEPYGDFSDLSSNVKYFHIKEKGLSLSRNFGLKYVTGDVVGLMDDDAEYLPNVLEVVNSFFSSHNDVSMISGKVVDFNSNNVYLSGMKDKYTVITEANLFNCCTSAAIFYRTATLKGQKFDEDFGVGRKWGSAEESDFVLRSLYLGNKAVYYPDVVIKHPYVDKRSIPFSRIENYGLGYGALIAKHMIQFNNRRLVKVYYKVLIKQLIAIGLSAVRLDFHMCKYYYVSFKSKRDGFRQYKEKYAMK